jgi:hypothetical protein
MLTTPTGIEPALMAQFLNQQFHRTPSDKPLVFVSDRLTTSTTNMFLGKTMYPPPFLSKNRKTFGKITEDIKSLFQFS